MSYEKLVSELYFVASGVKSERRRNLLVRAAEAIEELSSENKSLAKSVNQASDILRRRMEEIKRHHWVSVKERLPEKNVDVLAMSKYSGVIIDFLDDKGHFSVGDITHWMPVPPIPGEVGK